MEFEYNILDWDSELFGYKVGKILIKSLTDNDFIELKKKCINDQITLLYLIPLDESSKSVLTRNGYSPIDEKVIYQKRITKATPDLCLNIKSYSLNYCTKQLLKLVYVSGQYSRFKIDQNFKNNEFKTLYKIWINKSIKNKLLMMY
jgi:dTDP-4-amino-4,6-dideoxy-D-galactose acyltransferase